MAQPTLFDPFVREIARTPSRISEDQTRRCDHQILFPEPTGQGGFDAKTALDHKVCQTRRAHEWKDVDWVREARRFYGRKYPGGTPILDGGKPIGSIVFGLRAENFASRHAGRENTS